MPPDEPDLTEDEIKENKIDDLLGKINDQFIRERIDEGSTEKDYAIAAMNITEDRYSAGSTAAICTIIIMLRHGVEMAVSFAENLEHHEG